MSTGSVVSIVLTFTFVLGIMGLALRFLRKYTMSGTSRNGSIPMEVVQRLTLGQRQGIAVVRIGTRVFAVSMGDGGIHCLAELQPSEVIDGAQARAATTVPTSFVSNDAAHRISYVAPLEDFQAVLSMAMNGPSRL